MGASTPTRIEFLPGRGLGEDTVADVYRNLNREKRSGAVVYSVRARSGPWKGKTVGYAISVAMAGAEMTVRRGVQRRIAAGNRREVHAWLTGTIVAKAATPKTRITYRPHEVDATFRTMAGTPVESAATAAFTGAGVFVGGAR